jgi:hypothetical protein
VSPPQQPPRPPGAGRPGSGARPPIQRSDTPAPKAERVPTLVGLSPPLPPARKRLESYDHPELVRELERTEAANGKLLTELAERNAKIREFERSRNQYVDSLNPPPGGPPSLPPSKSGRHRAYWLLAGLAAVLAAGGGFAGCSQIVVALRGQPEVSKEEHASLLRAVGQLDGNVRQLWGEVRGLAGYQRGTLQLQQIETLDTPGAVPSTDLTPRQVPLVDPRRVRGKAPPIAQIPAPVVSPVPEPIDLGTGGGAP